MVSSGAIALGAARLKLARGGSDGIAPVLDEVRAILGAPAGDHVGGRSLPEIVPSTAPSTPPGVAPNTALDRALSEVPNEVMLIVFVCGLTASDCV